MVSDNHIKEFKTKILLFSFVLVIALTLSLYTDKAANAAQISIDENGVLEDNAANDYVEQVEIDNEDGEIEIETSMKNDGFKNDLNENDDIEGEDED